MNGSRRGRLPELEGLRGILSWWVVVCHLLEQVGYSESSLGRGLRLLLRGDYAVQVFIVLSGFVIHKLWHDAREPYGVFIARRFLRLWPAYIVCLIGALALRPCIAIDLAHAPLAGGEYLAIARSNWQSEEGHFTAHLLAHLPMLHSAVPETILPISSVAFLPPAWSISLEWQFYLIAPLLFWALAKGGRLAWLVFAAVAGYGWMIRYTPQFHAWYPMQAFLPQMLLLFGVGIVSHQVWMSFPETEGRAASALLGLAVLVLFFTFSIPIALWLATLSAVFAARSWFKSLLNSAPIQFLGRVSYSTYLGHMLVLWGLQALVFRVAPSVTAPQMLIALCAAGLPLTLALSALLYRWVEKPAIRFGRQWFDRESFPAASLA